MELEGWGPVTDTEDDESDSEVEDDYFSLAKDNCNPTLTESKNQDWLCSKQMLAGKLSSFGTLIGFGKQYFNTSTANILMEINIRSVEKIRKAGRMNKGRPVRRFDGNSSQSNEF